MIISKVFPSLFKSFYIICTHTIYKYIYTTYLIKYFNSKLNIRKNEQFIGGTMFMCRFEIMKKYLNIVNTIDIYKELEEGYFTDHRNPTKTHALERILGYMVGDCGKKIIGV